MSRNKSTNVDEDTSTYPGRKKKSTQSHEHIEANVEVVEGPIADGAKTAETGSTPDLAASIKQGFTQMSHDIANAISESFNAVRAEFEIQTEPVVEEMLPKTPQDGGNHEESGEPPAKKQNVQSTNIEDTVAKMANSARPETPKENPSNEGNFEVFSLLMQDLKKEETGPAVNAELAGVVNAMIKDGLPEEMLQEKMNKYHRPENCGSMAKVRVNQEVWDHITPHVRSQDLKLQKVQTSIFKGMCALTGCVNKLLEYLPSLPADNDLLQQSTDALALFANANNELNQRRRELIKPDLESEYRHLCSSTVAVTDQLFGDDLPKQVKDLTEVNRVGKKVSTNSGRSTKTTEHNRSSSYHNNYNRARGYQGFKRPFIGA